MRDEELILIGMKEAPPRPADDDPVARQTKASLPVMLEYFTLYSDALVVQLCCA